VTGERPQASVSNPTGTTTASREAIPSRILREKNPQIPADLVGLLEGD
jgi:hypothetical protein